MGPERLGAGFFALPSVKDKAEYIFTLGSEATWHTPEPEPKMGA